MKRLLTSSALALFMGAIGPTALIGQTYDNGSSLTAKEATTRIDLAARQRMLLERMAKSICFADKGVHIWDNELYLQSAYISFQIAHKGIAEGDAKLGISGETNRNFRETWRDLDLTWVTLSRLYDEFVNNKEIAPKDFENVMELTARAHDYSNEIVVQMRSNYAKFIGSNGFGNSILLDLYSKQKELTQELSKQVCLTANNVDKAANLEKLNATLARFQASLDGFRSGIPTLGIEPPPTERIAMQLDRTNDRWNEIRDYVHRVAKNEVLTPKEIADFEFGIDQVLREVDRVVFLLVDHIATGQTQG